MSPDHLNIDEPEETGRRSNKKATRSVWRSVLWFCGGLALVVGGIVAIFSLPAVQRLMTPAVTQHRSSAELRAEAARAFGDFDPSADPVAGSSPDERTEREGIVALFQELETAVRAGDTEATHKLIDFPRLFTRTKLTGKTVGLSRSERRDLQNTVRDGCAPSGFWSHIKVVAVVAVTDDPGTRVVYATAHDEGQTDQNEVRFWIARHGIAWKLYDWDRLDIPMSKSMEWGVIAWHTRAGTLGDHDHRTDSLVTLKRQIEAGEYADARKTLLAIERLRCPTEFTDINLTVNGYYWLWIHSNDEASRSFEKVGHPEEVPGAWHGLMLARQWSHPKQALINAEKYEAALGSNVSLCETKAQILARLNRKAEAAAEWKKVLRLDPNRNAALVGLLVLLPDPDKVAFGEYLDRTTDPVQTAGKLAPSVAWRDEAALTFLIDYIRSRQPEAPQLRSLATLAFSAAGDLEHEAAAHLELLLAETDAGERQMHISGYLATMTQLNRVVEAFDAIPAADQPAAFEILANPFLEDESDLSRGEFDQVLAHFRQRHPDDLKAVLHAVGLAIRDKRFDEAERDARAALRRLDERTVLRQLNERSASSGGTSPVNTPPGAPSTDGDPDEDSELRSSLQYHLAKALCHLGRVEDAWDMLPAESRFNRLYWIIEGVGGPSQRLNDLIRLQSASQPDDPDIAYCRGVLAERAGRTDDAITEYRRALTNARLRQAVKKAPGAPLGKYQFALRNLSVAADRWQEYIASPAFDDTQLEPLASDIVGLHKWEAFDELMNRRREPAERARLAAQASTAAWERQRYADCAGFCELALTSPVSGVPNWQQGTLRERQLVSLLRLKQFDEATKLAGQFRDEHADSLAPAVVCAAAGEFGKALSIAEAATDETGSANSLYHHSEVGGVFLRDEFSSLHEKFPVDLPFVVSQRTAVVLLNSPPEIDEQQLATIVQEAVSSEPTASQPTVPEPAVPVSNLKVESLTTQDPQQRAYCVRLGPANLWVVAGTGRFDPSLMLAESDSNDSSDQAALRTAVNGSKGYLMIGTAAWTDADRERISGVARRLTRRLTGPSTVAIQPGSAWQLHPPDSKLLDRWEATNSVGDRADQHGLPLQYKPVDTVVATRQFESELSAAARTFQPDGAPLEIVIAPISDPVLDSVTIRVTKVTRTYNVPAFEGVVQSTSVTIPELHAGLKVHAAKYRVQAWRSGGTEFHPRP